MVEREEVCGIVSCEVSEGGARQESNDSHNDDRGEGCASSSPNFRKGQFGRSPTSQVNNKRGLPVHSQSSGWDTPRRAPTAAVNSSSSSSPPQGEDGRGRDRDRAKGFVEPSESCDVHVILTNSPRGGASHKAHNGSPRHDLRSEGEGGEPHNTQQQLEGRGGAGHAGRDKKPFQSIVTSSAISSLFSHSSSLPPSVTSAHNLHQRQQVQPPKQHTETFAPLHHQPHRPHPQLVAERHHTSLPLSRGIPMSREGPVGNYPISPADERRPLHKQGTSDMIGAWERLSTLSSAASHPPRTPTTPHTPRSNVFRRDHSEILKAHGDEAHNGAHQFGHSLPPQSPRSRHFPPQPRDVQPHNSVTPEVRVPMEYGRERERLESREGVRSKANSRIVMGVRVSDEDRKPLTARASGSTGTPNSDRRSVHPLVTHRPYTVSNQRSDTTEESGASGCGEAKERSEGISPISPQYRTGTDAVDANAHNHRGVVQRNGNDDGERGAYSRGYADSKGGAGGEREEVERCDDMERGAEAERCDEVNSAGGIRTAVPSTPRGVTPSPSSPHSHTPPNQKNRGPTVPTSSSPSQQPSPSHSHKAQHDGAVTPRSPTSPAPQRSSKSASNNNGKRTGSESSPPTPTPRSSGALNLKANIHPEKLLRRKDLSVGGCLGRGGFGAVYAGIVRSTNERVAIKRLNLNPSTMGEKQRRELLREIEAIQSLQHRNLVRFVGAVVNDPTFICIVTELCSNGNLHTLLHTNPRRRITFERRQMIAAQVVEAVVFLHSQSPKVLHRDLKSLNVVLDSQWNAKICDFGLTTPMDSEKTHLSLKEGNNGGSPRYMAPECYDARAKISEKVDVWALGCILIEVFGGPVPFHDCTEIQHIITRLLVQKQGPYIPTWFPTDLRCALKGCLAFATSERWDAARALRCIKSVQPFEQPSRTRSKEGSARR